MESSMKRETMILGQDLYYSLDCYKTHVNNNVLIVGTSGSGKTRSYVTPNLLQATGSYIVSDPKGNLFRKYGPYLESKGYIVKKLDFTDPGKSNHYNFFRYIHSEQDIVKIAHMLVYQEKGRIGSDPFWEHSALLLLEACIAFLYEACPEKDRNLRNVSQLLENGEVRGNMEDSVSLLDTQMDTLHDLKPDSFAYRCYRKVRINPDRTLRCVFSELHSMIGLFDSPEIAEMTSGTGISIGSIGREKTALFVVVSDTDRSMDSLVNLFFTQAMNELCRVADKECEDEHLPIPVRFFLDDFATNCRIDEFPRMISSIRSRWISVMLMIQAESQLSEYYDHDAKTIIGNCDTYVYLGGNDIATAKAVAERCDLPLKRILNMPIDTNWVFRRGESPVNGRNYIPKDLPVAGKTYPVIKIVRSKERVG